MPKINFYIITEIFQATIEGVQKLDPAELKVTSAENLVLLDKMIDGMIDLLRQFRNNIRVEYYQRKGN